ncbi:AbrB/MazE/SpoVT family DNA-binding domain-containing protein [Aeropyrum pernix]|uniref:AbrB/MazE/SpoVT family DNA-binding domain-containing protein n=1 Tax=Aeropyrum pernix TaxID=56636 RepID=UPI0013F17937|nr:AbrB/MazE/SpoVT family DNA-binding domain-containing protein [Aeropyrum pernix]
MNLGRGGVRRLQKLGSSSLVVTLPKEWVREMGLKQGDPVYVVVEGGSLRIVPAVNSEATAASRIRLSGLDPGDATRVLWCAYVLGPEEVVLENAGDDVYNMLRDATSGFIGVDVVRDDDSVSISILVDPSKLDLRAVIRSVASDLRDIAELLTEAARGSSVEGEAERARIRLQRSITLAERYLMGVIGSHTGQQDARATASKLLAVNFLGLAASTLLDTVKTLSRGGGNASKETLDVLTALSTVASEAALNVASESLKRSSEVLANIAKLRSRVEELIYSDKTSKTEAVALARVLESLRHLHLATTLIYCTLKIAQNQGAQRTA